MTIALSAKRNQYVEDFFEQLRDGIDGELVWLEDADQAEVELLLAMGPVTREQMEAMPKLGLIQTLSDGYDAVDVEAATELGIYVSYAPGDETGNSDSVAEYAVMLLLAAMRRVGAEQEAMRAGKKLGTYQPALAGKTVLIAGLGDIGAKVAQRLRGFEVRLRGVDRTPSNAPFDIPTRPLEEMKEALGEADAVVICLRGAKENAHLFGADLFAAMKPGAVLVNVARGSLVDEAALVSAVESGQVGAAGLDVVEKEPVEVANPLLALPQVFVTPHIAGSTEINLRGTVRFVRGVVKKLAAGEKVKSLLNEPEKPRREVRGRSA